MVSIYAFVDGKNSHSAASLIAPRHHYSPLLCTENVKRCVCVCVCAAHKTTSNDNDDEIKAVQKNERRGILGGLETAQTILLHLLSHRGVFEMPVRSIRTN